jgi:hypothetical protein
MLDHLHAGHKVEAGQAQRRQLAMVIGDGQARPRRMGARRRDVFRRRVHARHSRAQPGQRLAQQARAAADIQRRFARQRAHAARIAMPVRIDGVTDETQSDRVQPVEHGGRTLGIPPIGRQLSEMFSFGGADCINVACCVGHDPFLKRRVALGQAAPWQNVTQSVRGTR